MDKEKISYDTEAEYHVLRHFEYAPEGVYKRLVEAGYTAQQIEDALSLTGSKFFKHFATSIEELLNKLPFYAIETLRGENSNWVLVCRPTSAESPLVGFDALVPLEKVAEKDITYIYKNTDRGYPLNHLEVDQLPATKQFVIVVKELGANYQFITAFPGQLGLPIPNGKMNETEYDKCKDFWESHVLLVKH